jgi:hypothetical protein
MSTYYCCSWIKDGQTLNVAGAGSGNGGGGNDLRLASVGRADRGWYRCLASNMAATRETDPVLLSVIGESMRKRQRVSIFIENQAFLPS